MFERYNEKARRTIFFARYEASQFGAQYIEPGHLMLGLFRENRTLLPELSVDTVRTVVEAVYPRGEKVSTSVDMPLSQETTKVLAHAAQEAESLGHKHVGPEHLLLGFMRDETSEWTRLLKAHGVEREAFRGKLAERKADLAPTGSAANVDLKIADTTRICSGREIRTIERIQLSEDGKRLVYSVEVHGPGKTGNYEITFELDKE